MSVLPKNATQWCCLCWNPVLTWMLWTSLSFLSEFKISTTHSYLRTQILQSFGRQSHHLHFLRIHRHWASKIGHLVLGKKYAINIHCTILIALPDPLQLHDLLYIFLFGLYICNHDHKGEWFNCQNLTSSNLAACSVNNLAHSSTSLSFPAWAASIIMISGIVVSKNESETWSTTARRNWKIKPITTY